MNRWQEQFAQQMNALCAQSSSWFDQFAQDVLDPTVKSITEYLDQWHYHFSTPVCEEDCRAFRFALTEDGYLLVRFRLEGFDALECEYEYSLPRVGRIQGIRTNTSLRTADPEWVESCCHAALNTFVTQFLEMGKRTRTAEPSLA